MTHNITCPHCGTAFQVNETEYSQLLAQVRGAEFDKEIHERLARETELLAQRAENDLQARLSDKDKEILELTANLIHLLVRRNSNSALPFLKKTKKSKNLRLNWGKSVLPRTWSCSRR